MFPRRTEVLTITFPSTKRGFDPKCTRLLGLPYQSTTDWGLKQQDFIFSQSWRLEVQGQGVGRFGSPEAPSPWLAGGRLLVCPHTAFLLCICVSGVSPSSYKDTSPIGLGTTHMTSFTYYFFKGSISKYSHILRYRGLGLRHMNFRGTPFNSQHQENGLV